MIASSPGAAVGGPPPVARLPHRDPVSAWTGMVLFLGSWAVMFASLFYAYGGIRARATAWPPPDQEPLPLLLPGINAWVAILASLALVVALRSLRSGASRRGAWALAAAAALGALFLGLQSVVWVSLWQGGLRPTGGPYGSVFYTLTGFHAAHVLIGLVALVALAVRAARGGCSGPDSLPVRLWGMYWHFVGAVWLVIYAVVYAV